ncbi:CsbD family protein [Mycolicibacterium arenosum]|uniref:CsbD family protein n=1 Tax=Mycolicibacterium arenosum TaxID=2952157 RepID=UPI0038CD2597
MSELTNKAEELAGRAKEAAGDLTDNDDLKADGAGQQAKAQVKQAVDTAAEKADEVKDAVADKAEDVAEDVKDTARQAVDTVTEKTEQVKTAVADKTPAPAVFAVVAVAGVAVYVGLRIRSAAQRRDRTRRAARVAKASFSALKS